MPPFTLDVDLPCIRCGYNLRSLAIDSRCPECGAAITVSLSPRPLAHIDPTLLRQLAVGLLLSLLSSLLAGVFCLGVDNPKWISLIALFPGGSKGWLLLLSISGNRGVPAWLTGVGFISLMAHLSSSLLLTPVRLRLPKASSLRRGYRYFSIGAFILVASTWRAPPTLFYVGVFVAFLCDLAQMILFIGCASDIAIAGGFHEIDIWLGRAISTLLFLVLISIGMLCGLGSFGFAAILLAIYLIAAYFAFVSVGRLAMALCRIKPLRDR